MMNLFYEPLPDSIEVDGEELRIVTDFVEYIKMIDMLADKELTDRDRACVLNAYFIDTPQNLSKALGALKDFVSMKHVHEYEQDESKMKKEDGQGKSKELFSFSFDFAYILAAFKSQYDIDLLETNMHWWKFRMLFNGLSDETEIKKRISYRATDLSKIKNQKERARIQSIQNTIRIPNNLVSDYDIGGAFW